MIRLVVLENPDTWPFRLEEVEVVPARAYLGEERFAGLRRAAVYNLCREYGYQSVGYYVSLLAAARGHRPLPSVDTLQSLPLAPVVRAVSEDLDDLVQRSLAPLRSEAFDLSIYFGRNVARRYDRLSGALFNQFPSPFLRARFVRNDRWKLAGIRPVAAGQVPEEHREFVLERAREYFARPLRPGRRREYRYDMAVLWDEGDPTSPSDEGAVRRFLRAAHAAGIGAEVVGREEYGRLGEYDALFIRETTAVDHHTFRFARRAEAEGLVVVDDPESIIRCGNKVYQAELFRRHGVPAPPTLVVSRANAAEVERAVGLPCVLKSPDGAFSMGVARVDSAEALGERLQALLSRSELVVAQAWSPTPYDWRIGVLGGRPLFAARYQMAAGHWQIVRREGGRPPRYGRVDAVPVEEVPPEVVEVAVRAAGLIGDGLYGVDVKALDEGPVVLEVNDNPNIEAGCEDGVLGDALYEEVMAWFLARLEARGTGA